MLETKVSTSSFSPTFISSIVTHQPLPCEMENFTTCKRVAGWSWGHRWKGRGNSSLTKYTRPSPSAPPTLQRVPWAGQGGREMFNKQKARGGAGEKQKLCSILRCWQPTCKAGREPVWLRRPVLGCKTQRDFWNLTGAQMVNLAKSKVLILFSEYPKIVKTNSRAVQSPDPDPAQLQIRFIHSWVAKTTLRFNDSLRRPARLSI